MRHIAKGDVVRLKESPQAPAVAKAVGVKVHYRYTVTDVRRFGTVTAIRLQGVAKRFQGQFWNETLFEIECSHQCPGGEGL